MSEKVDFYDFEKFFDKVYEEFLENVKYYYLCFEVLLVQVMIVGNRMIIENFVDIVEVMNCDLNYFFKFILREVVIVGIFEGRRVIFQGCFMLYFIVNKMKKYFKEFVICFVCGSLDMKIIKKGCFYFFKCEVCG